MALLLLGLKVAAVAVYSAKTAKSLRKRMAWRWMPRD